MIQINIGDHAGNENGVAFTPILPQHRGQVRWSRTKAFWIAKNIPTANRYFTSLPRGRTLTAILNDSSIWINFDPTLPDDGATFHNKDLWIGPRPFRIGRWTVLATIIHELAHINGAGGAATGLTCSSFSSACHAAERAVLECGMGKRSELNTRTDDPATPYNPNITG
jgi:hypothetical protein